MNEPTTITIYGASDDLIEVEGAIEEEFYALSGENLPVLSFSDGTVLHVEYTTSGIWRITRIAKGTAAYEKKEAIGPEDDYSDRVTLTGDDLKWVVYGSFAKAAQQ